MKSIKQILEEKGKVERNKYISREFQDFAYRLADELGDPEHRSLYMRLAKTMDRGLLEKARSFAIDSTARKKGALFMWKLSQLKKEKDGIPRLRSG